MELIPLIYIKNRKLYVENEGEQISLDEILKNIDKNNKIYFLDVDGIDKNKPNLCTYQRILPNYEIWVDAGPRVIGDVVDFVMAGATSVTIRKNLFPINEISKIKEMTESKIYIVLDLQNEKQRNANFSFILEVDGFVIFYDENQIEKDFKSSEFLKTLCSKFKVYAIDPHGKNTTYWKNRGAAGLLIDFKRIKQVNV